MLPTPLSDLDLQAAERAYVDHLSQVIRDMYEGLQKASSDAARQAALRRAQSAVAKAREIRLIAVDLLNQS
jgi:hypothetical protein